MRIATRYPFLVLCFVICERTQADPGIAFFEAKIRPVLVEHCYRCHSADAQKGTKLKAGLLLDHRAGLLIGGDSGPAIVPGKSKESLLMKALRHEELQMPPSGKLPAQVIADFAEWIDRGGPDPRQVPAVSKNAIDMVAARKHWAFQAIHAPAVPMVKESSWAATPIDHFVLARLEAAGLSPSPPVGRRTYLRRVMFDLVGLPPTRADVEAFEKDDSPDAFARLVDRLLASPAYGERWGRHWLDVARYADTKDGVLQYGDARIRPYAYTYRDYVIRSFNEDVPFDQFIHEQLAADQIEPKVAPWKLAAMGFLTLGRQFDNNVHDVIDDRIDVVTRGLLGVTVACARCHDHKYDPIPTADYYSLYGVFASSTAPLELPLIVSVDSDPSFAAFEKAAAAKRAKVQQFHDAQYVSLSEQARQRVGDYLVHVATTAPDPLETAIFFLSLAPTDLRPQIVHRWRRFLEHPDRVDDPIFGPWHELARLSEPAFAKDAGLHVARWAQRSKGNGRGQINPLVLDGMTKNPPRNRKELAQLYGRLLREAYEATKKGLVGEEVRQLALIVSGTESPCHFPKHLCHQYMSRGEKDSYNSMIADLDLLAVRTKSVPPRSMSLVDTPEAYAPRVFVRGNPAQLGELVPRRFLGVLSGESRQPFANGSGRLDLAKAITGTENPLTSRVMVNRVWMHHFGEPLVNSPSDFGLRTGPPTHPELLDWLARVFMDGGWSLKKLHRLIVLSNTYRQESLDRPDARKVDPDNRLWWRANRRRLDFEAMRDALLHVSGRLDNQVFGRPVDVANDSKNRRRTVYGLVDRQSLPGVFRTFDFAVPDQSVERRPQTTVPQQALFAMNSPFMLEQARSLATRPEVAAAMTEEGRVGSLYALVLARAPSPREIEVGVRFLREVPAGSQLRPLEQYAQVLLLTNEMMFVD